jgi:acetyltransferase-like isoleucine patch superfamily enzyme
MNIRLFKSFFFLIFASINFFIFRAKKVRSNTKLLNIKGIPKIRGKGKISIGKGTRMNSGMIFNPIGGDNHILFVCSVGAEIRIGENCGLSNCCIVSRKKVTIGNNVLIGGSVKIYDTDFHSLSFLDRRESVLDQKSTVSKAVNIGDDVFIGAHSLILKGVSIGQCAIVGGGSVVTKNIPPFEIWGGNPARFIKKRETEHARK